MSAFVGDPIPRDQELAAAIATVAQAVSDLFGTGVVIGNHERSRGDIAEALEQVVRDMSPPVATAPEVDAS